MPTGRYVSEATKAMIRRLARLTVKQIMERTGASRSTVFKYRPRRKRA
jgi:predicted DNA-binding transcriptional regulator AlpA